MSRPDKYEAIDKAALRSALLALHQCPRCRRPLRPIWTGEPDTWACVGCDEVYYIPPETV